jgi:adenosylcobinamide kinase/adenosylcobinamide-phosphate guanylyltransferase
VALVLLTGGARSGKSQLAVALATRQPAPVVVVATGEAGDDEMAERIRRHRDARPPSWTTIEEPFDLAGAVGRVPAESFLVVDCLSVWVANLMGRELPDEQIVARGRDAASLVAARPAGAVAVTNEVGSAVVPDNPMARRFRDLLGTVNAAWAAVSARAALVVAGQLLPLSQPDDTWTKDTGWMPN